MEEIVEAIKVYWRWILVRKRGWPYTYFDWYFNTLLCLNVWCKVFVFFGL